MGVQDVTCAELYKLLVYDPGAFFIKHRDTAKSPGMFGTLVVVLPSEHTGGELVVNHGGKEVTMSLANNEVSEIRFAAFYADCEHEVKPITSGNRICLIYNLVRRSRVLTVSQGINGREDRKQAKKVTSSALANFDNQEIISQIAQELFTTLGASADIAPAKLVYILSHYYTPSDLVPSSLKSGDLVVANALAGAAEQAGITLYFGHLHIFTSQSGSDPWDISTSIDGLATYPGGKKESLGPLSVEHSEMFPRGIIDTESPDEHRHAEYTGNEGSLTESSYYRVALVMWKTEAKALVVAQNGFSRMMKYVQALIDERGGIDDTNRGEIAKGMSYLRLVNRDFDVPKTVAILVALGDLGALHSFVVCLLTSDCKDREIGVALASSHLELEDALNLVRKLLSTSRNLCRFVNSCKGTLQPELESRVFALVGQFLVEKMETTGDHPYVDAWKCLDIINDAEFVDRFMRFLQSPQCGAKARCSFVVEVCNEKRFDVRIRT